MRKNLLTIVAILICTNIFSQQNTTKSRIAYIRKAYSEYKIDDNGNSKHTYEKQETDLSYEYYNPILNLDEYYKTYNSDEDDNYGYQKTITRYYENNVLRLAKMYGYLDNSYSIDAQSAECYYDADGLYFLYVVDSKTPVYQDNVDFEFSTTEYRYYFDQDGKCIRLLKKDYGGPYGDIEAISKAANNVEIPYVENDPILTEIKTLLEKHPTAQ